MRTQDGRWFRFALVVCFLLALGAARAHAGGIATGTYTVTAEEVVSGDEGCPASSTPVTFSFTINRAGVRYTLTPSTGFPFDLKDSANLVKRGRAYIATFTFLVDRDTTVSLVFNGKRVKGGAATDHRCSPIYNFVGARAEAVNTTTCDRNPTTCTRDTICIAGACVPAFDRQYVFTVRNATIRAKSPDGSAWDPHGGAPDPYAVVTLNGSQILLTETLTDTYNAQWTAASLPVVVPAGSILTLDVLDKDDGNPDDGIYTCKWQLTADNLHGGAVLCDDPQSQQNALITIDLR
ncbi:MAG TPA: C2 domain-containing protein [Kofleriaceae bacterium]|nr:C2 domain-containing protein [Kofleriaceae bacterium]